ncbi:hypothetical protein QE410_003250 [Microbacterium sp. SORGH_AS 1204]|uniref:hypothetical protein n=1 Tax=Microbacterium sp. SORGH_AS_1204 TaxID=3041785 RepID=UPI002792F601|nr:hypothetical protein [Microbacterium sp. SORGH_AS_1204]MDQ1138451.1 hypothetical protein [Microbacterium sp. SORGH_AS_1204]
MKRALLSSVALASALVMSSCSATASTAGAPDEEAAAVACPELHTTSTDESPAPQHEDAHYNVLIELTSNAPENQDQILARVQPFIECAVDSGAYLEVTLDGGEGTPLVTPDGLDGTDLLTIKRVNPTRERKDKDEKISELVQSLREAISSAQIGRYGSVQRLLNYAFTLASDTAPGDSSFFIVWSPLLGTSSDGTDCLDVSTVDPSESNAAAVVQRCLDQGFIRPVPNAGVEIDGAATGSHDREQQRFADYLKKQLLLSVFGVK